MKIRGNDSYWGSREKSQEGNAKKLTKENGDPNVQSPIEAIQIMLRRLQQATYIRERNQSREWDITFNVWRVICRKKT